MSVISHNAKSVNDTNPIPVKLVSGSGAGQATDVNITNLPAELTETDALKVSNYPTIHAASIVIAVDTTPQNFGDADIYVIQANPENTADIRYGYQNMSHWLKAGEKATWYGPLTVSAPSVQDLAITPYKR